ncbi:MAG: hypothetical protein ACXQTQ_05290 [Candidatus Hecatellaceae archaeon]|nr:MAG: hypothetical protein DRO43_02815 [Candidatus Hecatellales archaeon]
MSSRDASYARRVKRAAQLLLFQRHRTPGVKGWELRKSLGKNYLKIVKLLDSELERLGLQVKIVPEASGETGGDEEARLDRARFLVTLRGSLPATDAQSSGWRIDDLAALAATLAYLASRQGKASRSEVERLLSSKLPSWRVSIALDRFVKLGYLHEDENEVLTVGWRTRAEVDLEALAESLLTISEEPLEAGERED